jgi:hypothetical protein
MRFLGNAWRHLWAAPNTLLGIVFSTLAIGGRIRLVDGALEAHGPALKWCLRHLAPLRNGVAAITFGHVVLGCDAESLEWTREHERVHVRQYERWGPLFLPAYLLASASALLRGRHAYLDNRFEREARERGGS